MQIGGRTRYFKISKFLYVSGLTWENLWPETFDEKYLKEFRPCEHNPFDVKAVTSFLLGEEIPDGFYLSHTDPGSQETIYFSTTIGTGGDSPTVPEPGTVLLLGAGLLGFASLRKRSSDYGNI